MNDPTSGDAEAVRELLLGRGGSSMRKSYYPELKNRLDDLELFRELFDRSSDAIMTFSVPANTLQFANETARSSFGVGCERCPLRIQDVLGSAESSGCVRFFESDEETSGSLSFIEERERDGETRRYEVVANKATLSGGQSFGITIARDATERLLMEERIKKNLVEKETMLKEIHHRVKNNFQLMQSILALQAASIDDERAKLPLIDSQNRILSMAFVHERLYESPDLGSVDAVDYIRDLVGSIQANFETILTGFEVSIRGERLDLPLDIILPCGLIANELVSNSIKHAFSPKEWSGEPAIDISIGRAGSGWGYIEVSDNGIGIDEDKLKGSPKSIGLLLIRTLVDQVRGRMEVRGAKVSGAQLGLDAPHERGTTTRIEFPLGAVES
jgi:two-component system, sensor histidine kinase PdtaS